VRSQVTFLTCCGLDGDTESLIRLRDLIDKWRTDAVLFAGCLLRPSMSWESTNDDAERHQFELTLLDSFFSMLGGRAKYAAVIGVPYDAPLSSFLRAGLTAHRSARRVAHWAIVNPGRLSNGCATLVDWSAAVDNQVEMLHIGI
jgi:hypothetical protein